MGCKGTIPNWCQKVEVCLELHSCSSWACFQKLFDILVDIPVYFNCCFGYGVGCKSVFSSRWFNQSTDWPLPLTLWLEFYMVIIKHACIHWKCWFILLLISKRSTKSSCCRSGATLSVKSEAKNSQNKPQWAFSLQQVVERRAKQSPVSLQNQTWITAEYAKWDLQMFFKLVGVARILCLLLRSRRDLTFYTCK